MAVALREDVIGEPTIREICFSPYWVNTLGLLIVRKVALTTKFPIQLVACYK